MTNLQKFIEQYKDPKGVMQDTRYLVIKLAMALDADAKEVSDAAK